MSQQSIKFAKPLKGSSGPACPKDLNLTNIEPLQNTRNQTSSGVSRKCTASVSPPPCEELGPTIYMKLEGSPQNNRRRSVLEKYDGVLRTKYMNTKKDPKTAVEIVQTFINFFTDMELAQPEHRAIFGYMKQLAGNLMLITKLSESQNNSCLPPINDSKNINIPLESLHIKEGASESPRKNSYSGDSKPVFSKRWFRFAENQLQLSQPANNNNAAKIIPQPSDLLIRASVKSGSMRNVYQEIANKPQSNSSSPKVKKASSPNHNGSVVILHKKRGSQGNIIIPRLDLEKVIAQQQFDKIVYQADFLEKIPEFGESGSDETKPAKMVIGKYDLKEAELKKESCIV